MQALSMVVSREGSTATSGGCSVNAITKMQLFVPIITFRFVNHRLKNIKIHQTIQLFNYHDASTAPPRRYSALLGATYPFRKCPHIKIHVKCPLGVDNFDAKDFHQPFSPQKNSQELENQIVKIVGETSEKHKTLQDSILFKIIDIQN